MARYISKIILSGVLMAGLCTGLGIGYAAEKDDPDIIKEVTMKKMTGEVEGISQNFISILYSQDKKASYEMAFGIDKDVKIPRYEEVGFDLKKDKKRFTVTESGIVVVAKGSKI